MDIDKFRARKRKNARAYYYKNKEKCLEDKRRFHARYKKDLNVFIQRMYAFMRARILGYANRSQYYKGLPLCDKREFYKFAMRSWELKYMFHSWTLSGHKKALLPTPDRIINSRGYAIDNIQFLTFKDNLNKRIFSSTKSQPD